MWFRAEGLQILKVWGSRPTGGVHGLAALTHLC